jgi:hypothetical protein
MAILRTHSTRTGGDAAQTQNALNAGISSQIGESIANRARLRGVIRKALCHRGFSNAGYD